MHNFFQQKYAINPSNSRVKSSIQICSKVSRNYAKQWSNSRQRKHSKQSTKQSQIHPKSGSKIERNLLQKFHNQFSQIDLVFMSKKQEQSSKNQFSIVPRILHNSAYPIWSKMPKMRLFLCKLPPIFPENFDQNSQQLPVLKEGEKLCKSI